jgi:peptide/nickel transport system permease protein
MSMNASSTAETRAIESSAFIIRRHNSVELKAQGFKEQLKELKDQKLSFLLVPGKPNAYYEARSKAYKRFRSKRSFLKRLKNPLSILGIFIVFLVVSWAVFAPLLCPYNYEIVAGVDKNSVSWAPPSPEHILGTSKFGRDLYSRLIWGARSSLLLGFFPLVIATVCGAALGLTGGYYGGIIDSIIMRISDIIMAFPGLILLILTISTFGYSISNVLIVMGLLGVPGFARLIRGGVLSEKDATYVQAAKVSGASDASILFKHILPNVLSPVIVAFTFGIGGNILNLAGLSFLGVTDSGLVEWGTDINVARAKLYVAPLSALIPGFGVFITVLGFMLLGDGLRDAFDPRLH